MCDLVLINLSAPFVQLMAECGGTPDMSKTVLPSKSMEWKGLDRISTTVHEMGNIWREMTKDDFGLDGEIEVVAPKANGEGFETTGGIVKVQSKAGERYVRYDTDTSFSSPVDQSDLESWQKCTFPVLYIVYHPKDDKLYFKEVQAYIRDTLDVFSKPHHIKFDKTKDEFTASSKPAVSQHAKVSPPRISFDQKERLFTNLLPIKNLPETIYFATTRRKSRQGIRDEIDGFVPPFCIVDGKLYSLSDLANDRCALKNFCVGQVATKPANEWIGNEERVNDFVYLLNQLLGKHMGRCGVRYNPYFGRNYFPRENTTDTAFKRAWTSVRTGVADKRTVVKYYEYGLDKFWRHLACEMSFERFGVAWFLRIKPKYFFTKDGEKPCDGELVGPYTTSLKADEHNSQVLNHVLFWADVLASQKSVIEVRLDGQIIMRIDKMPLTGMAHFAIPDDPATFEEKAPSNQPSLFDSSEDYDGEGGTDA